ncbi:MAG TPA: hypothetical protein PLY87_13285 [Planctomycetaceae bacterium]|nr:hypothetical protein [Planctomycetaceae bacterium]HQZ66053.1 hypothetical protein [Planctomycetaceae bacterium]
MIDTIKALLATKTPFGANGASGGGGGQGGDTDHGGRSRANIRGILVIPKSLRVESVAAGHIPRQEAILCYTEEAPGGQGHLITWFRSFFQGNHSGYRWLIPTPPCRYRPDNADLYHRLEEQLRLSVHRVQEERIENGVIISTKAGVLDYIKDFDFDLCETAIDHYIDKGWEFLGLQVFGTFFTDEPLFNIVSNPVRVKTETSSRNIVYPMVLTGSSLDPTTASTKRSEIRLYVVTRYRLQSYPKFLSPTREAVVEFDLGDWFVTVLEGTATTEDMKQDIVIELDRSRMFYE